MSVVDPIEFKPIGFIESCYRDKFGTPRQPGLVPSAESRLRLHAEWQPEEALEGLEGFSHVWLLWVFHQNKNLRYHAKVHPPRLGGASMGLFATRTPHRPNPIGLSLVKLEKIVDGVLYFSGADLVDGTPILDVKPYLPFIESRPEAKVGWVESGEIKKASVNFTEQAEQDLATWQQRHPELALRALVIETLQLDPRPTVYKGFQPGESPYRSEHACRLWDGDVKFRFVSDGVIEVFHIEIDPI